MLSLLSFCILNIFATVIVIANDCCCRQYKLNLKGGRGGVLYFLVCDLLYLIEYLKMSTAMWGMGENRSEFRRIF